MKCKVLNFELNADPEPKFIGIATVMIETDGSKFIVPYQINNGKDGRGIFVAPFSKMMNGVWYKAFMSDSNYENEEISKTVRSYYLNQPKATSEEEAPF